jgi:two-component system response regulator (stage 0 sporulation protein F)
MQHLKGKISQIIGPVVDVVFDGDALPELYEALRVEGDESLVLEVEAREVAEHTEEGLLREVLERSGHKVVEAKDGREALDLYQKHKADLLIMDLLMPEVDGLEATLQLTREYMDTKIIAMTGAQGDRNFLDIARLFGAHRTFEKPFDLKEMLNAVEAELAQK